MKLKGEIVHIDFETIKSKTVLDVVNDRRYPINGNSKQVGGVSGRGLKYDGFTTGISLDASATSQIFSEITVSAWIAPQTYPWNWCSIISRENQRKSGFFFGINAEGRIGFHVAANGMWVECNSEMSVPFMKSWSHVAATVHPKTGITVYINGKKAGRQTSTGTYDFGHGLPLSIGRNTTPLPPAALVREWVAVPTLFSFDGIIDEVAVCSASLSALQIAELYESKKTGKRPDLTWRKLPKPAESPSFRAYYTKLAFYPEWDDLWRVTDFPDIVVDFGLGKGHAVFWRGTNYNMNLVTENGRWVGDQSAETGGNWNLSQGNIKELPTGCMEHMSDKQNRFAHVRIIENTQARVVVHWRYALVDILYRIAEPDPQTGWGIWADEYYTIYPDGVCIRSACVHGPGSDYSLTEPATYNQPGEKAEDNIETAAVTVANLAGKHCTYTWDPWPEIELADANMCIVNFKSKKRPFYIFEEGAFIGPYGAPAEQRPEYSLFPTWNHWPVSQIPSDGRYALAPDRVSSSAVLSPTAGFVIDPKDKKPKARFIMGLSDKSVTELLPLAKSWLYPPAISGSKGSFLFKGYQRDDRAFHFSRTGSGSLDIKVQATSEHPVNNPVFLLHDWGDREAEIVMNQDKLKAEDDYKMGFVHTLTSTDLVVVLILEATDPLELKIQ